jgi:hypothetical protein
MLNILED